jgi:TetR/AcrR family transcriptional regulator
VPIEPDSRTSILDAAERLFARRGFAGTTIKQIGADAGVNAALMYYYFADKETLYRETLRRLFADLAGGASKRIAMIDDPVPAIRAFVHFQVEFLLARPHLPRLLIRELVDHEAAHAWDYIPQLTAATFSRLCELIRAGQRAGRFRADIDPVFAAIHTVGLVPYAFIARPAVARMLEYESTAIPDDVMRKFGEHAAEFVLGALAA